MVATLRGGDHGIEVTALQAQLNAAGAALDADGWFGPATEQALRVYQRAHHLVADGIAGPKTRATLYGLHLRAALSQADIDNAAAALDADVAAVLAVNEVESRGLGFIAGTILPVILYERHIMYRRMQHYGLDAATAMHRQPGLVNTQPGGYQGGMAEHRRLGAAREIDDTSALESASWGAFQILGEHATRLGYDRVQDFAAAMRSGEPAQLSAFVRFVRADHHLLHALQKHDWPAFAAGYNGRDYAMYDYDHKLTAAYRRHAAAIPLLEAA